MIFSVHIFMTRYLLISIEEQSGDCQVSFIKQIIFHLFIIGSSYIHDLFMTCNWLVYDLIVFTFSWFPQTCLWLVHDLSMTCSWLVHDFFMTCSWPVHDLFMTCSWLTSSWHVHVHNLCMTCPWLVPNFFKTCPWLIYDLFMTYSWLFPICS